MARGRMIDKVIILSKKINAISEGAENLYYRILANADDFGHYHADAIIIKGQIYTLRKIPIKQIENRIKELSEIGLIKLYKNNDELYLEIADFEKHQTFKIDRPKKAEYPKPISFLEDSGNQMDTNGSLSKDKLSKDKLSKDTYAPTNNLSELESLPPHKRIQFNWQTKEWEGITEEDFKILKEAYPACDIKLELKRWISWALANPKKAKKSNYLKSINFWLSKNQDKGGTRGIKETKDKEVHNKYMLSLAKEELENGEMTEEAYKEALKKYGESNDEI